MANKYISLQGRFYLAEITNGVYALDLYRKITGMSLPAV